MGLPQARGGRGLLPLSLTLILLATLLPGQWTDAEGRRLGQYPFLVDAVLNVMLFVPFGAALALRSCSPWRSVLVGALLSGMIEVAQLWVPGRFSDAGDIGFNALGVMVGWALLHWAWGSIWPEGRRTGGVIIRRGAWILNQLTALLRRTRFQMASIGLGLVIGLIAAEMAAAVLFPATPLQGAYHHYATDAYLPYKPTPSSRITGWTNEFDFDYQHNSFGFRDVEHSLAKETGTFRILGLGDSFTYGAGVAFEETYLHRLETMLNSRAGTHPRVEIIKAGISRYFPEPERILLERYGAHFQPDLILVGFVINDVIDTYQGLDAVTVDASGYLVTREAKALGEWGRLIYRYSGLGRVVLKSYVNWRIERDRRPRWSELFRSGGFHEGDWQKMEDEYGKMAAIATSLGAKLVLVHIPQKGPWTAESRYPATRLSAWAVKRDVGFIDLLPAMEGSVGVEPLYYERDGHCTPVGHALIARELYTYLTDNALIP